MKHFFLIVLLSSSMFVSVSLGMEALVIESQPVSQIWISIDANEIIQSIVQLDSKIARIALQNALILKIYVFILMIKKVPNVSEVGDDLGLQQANSEVPVRMRTMIKLLILSSNESERKNYADKLINEIHAYNLWLIKDTAEKRINVEEGVPAVQRPVVSDGQGRSENDLPGGGRSIRPRSHSSDLLRKSGDEKSKEGVLGAQDYQSSENDEIEPEEAVLGVQDNQHRDSGMREKNGKKVPSSYESYDPYDVWVNFPGLFDQSRQ